MESGGKVGDISRWLRHSELHFEVPEQTRPRPPQFGGTQDMTTPPDPRTRCLALEPDGSVSLRTRAVGLTGSDFESHINDRFGDHLQAGVVVAGGGADELVGLIDGDPMALAVMPLACSMTMGHLSAIQDALRSRS